MDQHKGLVDQHKVLVVNVIVNDQGQVLVDQCKGAVA